MEKTRDITAMFMCPQPDCGRKIVEFTDGSHRKISKGFAEFTGKIIPLVVFQNCNHHGGEVFDPVRHGNIGAAMMRAAKKVQ